MDAECLAERLHKRSLSVSDQNCFTQSHRLISISPVCSVPMGGIGRGVVLGLQSERGRRDVVVRRGTGDGGRRVWRGGRGGKEEEEDDDIEEGGGDGQGGQNGIGTNGGDGRSRELSLSRGVVGGGEEEAIVEQISETRPKKRSKT